MIPFDPESGLESRRVLPAGHGAVMYESSYAKLRIQLIGDVRGQPDPCLPK